MAKGDFVDHIFVEDGDYPRLISGAHRRAITPITSPSLTRHVGLWDRSRRPNAGDELPSSQPAKLAVRADNALIAIYAYLRRGGCADIAATSVSLNNAFNVGGKTLHALFGKVIDTDCEEASEYRPDSYRALKLNFVWQCLPITLSFEVHTEMVTISYLIDASRATDPPQNSVPRPVFDKVLKALSGIGQHDHAANCENHRILFADIWADFDQQVLIGAKAELEALGPKFLDFRGVLLGVAPSAQPAFAQRLTSWFRGNGRHHSPFNPPFSPVAADTRSLERSTRCTLEAFERLTNILRDANPDGTELTASRFLTDRAFYVTALGEQGMPKPVLTTTSQRTEHGVQSTGAPLCYFVYEDTLNKWQLGRLIYRLQRAGTMRVAASMYFDDLLAAAGKLNAIEDLIDDTLANITDKESKNESTHAIRKYGINQYRHSEELVSEALRWSSSSDLPKNPLDYRIERSKYYVEQFHRITKALRSERVGGFQPYPDFVEQRLGPVYDYIAGIGERYRRMQERREFLRGRLQRIDAMMDQKAITLAQAGGDIALGILVPYYLAHILIETHVFSEAKEQPMLWRVLGLLGTYYIIVQLFRAIANESPDGFKLGGFLFDAISQSSRTLRIAYVICLATATIMAIAAAYPVLSPMFSQVTSFPTRNSPERKAPPQGKSPKTLPPAGRSPRSNSSSPSSDIAK